MNSLINKFKQGYCNCGICEPDQLVNGRKVGKEFMCMGSYDNMKRNEQLDRQKKRNALATDSTKVRTFARHTQDKEDGLSELIIDADRLFSRYVRLRDMGADEKCTCISCGVRKNWKKMQCGHYSGRSNKGLRYENLNGNSQCAYCNCNLHGNLKLYAENLEKIHPGATSWLEEQARYVSKPSREELKQIISNLQHKLSIIEKAKGLKP